MDRSIEIRLQAQLIKDGLLQFGHFVDGDQSTPLRVVLEMLPSYPETLQLAAEVIATRLASYAIDRLLVPNDSVALGTAVSLKTGLPLVYSQGKGKNPRDDLIGAYDIGHPTAVILHTWEKTRQNFTLGEQQVGLEVKVILPLVSLAPKVQAGVIDLGEMMEYLIGLGMIPKGQGEAVVKWVSG
ncbi:MAG: hypothetical protein MUF87_06385 [Anaerolineae bacterium]|jgi:hypothetical protein|nr:hypothetical protein [Anaerolineae bacterium]